MPRRTRTPLAACAALLLVAGCQAGYVIEQAWGQWRLSGRQVPLESPDVARALPDDRREKLAWIPRILAFARTELDLTPGDAYETFLDTRGDPISHVVTAAHPLAMIPYQWCFPVTGCVTYKGYFDPDDARAEADGLRADGWDVEIIEVRAYSTLGWFRDPVLSTMLDNDVPDLVELILHETVHRTVYVPDWTVFNESLATHVAREGTLLFMQRHEALLRPHVREEYLASLAQRDQDDILMHRVRRDLDALYRSNLPDAEKRARKDTILATARKARGVLFGGSVASPASNAYVLASESYHDLLPRLAEMEEEAGGHPRALMAYLKEMVENGSLPEALR